MCGRFALTAPPEAVAQLFAYIGRPNFPPRYNIAPTQPIGIVRIEEDARHYALVRWGMVPSWTKSISDIPLLINARSETATQKPSFKSAMKYRRCLIPADAFYEWQRPPGGAKQAYMITRQDRSPFAFAGLWENWMDAQGNELESAAILTCAANETLAPVHHRMPVILGHNDFDAWLDVRSHTADDVGSLLVPAAEELLETVPVSNLVNKVVNDNPAVQVPEQSQTPAAKLENAASVGAPESARAATDQLDLF